MKTSHEGLGITEEEWDAFVKHSVATLDDLGVAEREKNELLAVAGSFRADIVEVHVSRAGR